jgi:hypothetical protein
MMPFDSYKIYLSLKNHFTKSNYDYHKYCGKTRASVQSFYKRKDRFWFEKISRQKSEKEVEQFFVANFVSCSDPESLWIGDMIKEGFVNIFKGMVNSIVAILNGLIWFSERTINAIIGGLNSAIGMLNKIPGVNISASIGQVSLPRVPSLAIGTNEVLSDGLANIHKGEAIVPANVVKGGFKANGMSGGDNITINIDASNSVNPDGFERDIMNKIDYAFGQVKGAR